MRIAWLLVLSSAFVLAQDANKCAALQQSNAKILDAAVLNLARAAQGNAAAVPEHCEILGKLNERIGYNSQRYAIKFHMRLPSQWNGKFFFEGGGGTNGNLGTGMGNIQGSQRTTGLSLGYAVVTQDSGHDNNVNTDPNLNGASTFAFDPQARIDYAYNSYDQVTQTAKSLIRSYYGRAPERSYFAGCSEGGREAIMMTQKYPAYFDGVLACAPGIKIPLAALTQVWNVQTLAEVAKSAGLYDQYGVPFVNKTFTDEDLALVAGAVLDGCDALDGVKDGIVANFMECNTAAVRPKLTALTCKGAKRAPCISAAQVAAVEKIFGGPKNARGESLYSDWAWDSGVGGKQGEGYFQGWRAWSIGDYEAKSNASIAGRLVAPSMAALVSPPEPIQAFGGAPYQYMLQTDISAFIDKAKAVSRPNYPTSTWDMQYMAGTDLAAFKARGGKFIIAHGASDPIFSVKDSIAWYGELNKVNGGSSADFARLFAIPGMNHCQGGPATDQFDAFSALVNWVEKGTAPDQIIATAGPASPWPGRTRPLCAYPKIAHYKGSGSLEEAASFVCQ